MNHLKQRLFACVLLLVLHHSVANAISASDSNDNQVSSSGAYSNELSQAELAQVLAPIALYPDSLLSHIMIASTYPLEVVEAYRWQQANSELDPAEAAELAEQNEWDPSVIALVAFPNVLERLNDDLQWTQNLGNAFLEDEALVLETIQVLRQQAKNANSLEGLKNMRVTQQNQQIIIEPVRREVVYVPYYDTRIVYGNWHWRRYPPVYWDYRPHSPLYVSGSYSGRFGWSAGININFNYFFSAFEWRSRHLVVSYHHNTRHYRSHHRIARSYGAKRWEHKPQHRRGVVYRSHKVNARYENSYAKRGLNHGVKQGHKNYAKSTHKLGTKHGDLRSRISSQSKHKGAANRSLKPNRKYASPNKQHKQKVVLGKLKSQEAKRPTQRSLKQSEKHINRLNARPNNNKQLQYKSKAPPQIKQGKAVDAKTFNQRPTKERVRPKNKQAGAKRTQAKHANKSNEKRPTKRQERK